MDNILDLAKQLADLGFGDAANQIIKTEARKVREYDKASELYVAPFEGSGVVEFQGMEISFIVEEESVFVAGQRIGNCKYYPNYSDDECKFWGTINREICLPSTVVGDTVNTMVLRMLEFMAGQGKFDLGEVTQNDRPIRKEDLIAPQDVTDLLNDIDAKEDEAAWQEANETQEPESDADTVFGGHGNSFRI